MLELKSVIDEINRYHIDNQNLECEFEYVGLDKVVFTAAPFITLPAMGKITITFEAPTYFNFNLYGEGGFFYTDENENFIDIISDKDDAFKLLKRDFEETENLFKINLDKEQIIIVAENLQVEITQPK